MIQVDISNIWGEVSLTDLLSIESELSAAHMAVTYGDAVPAWLELPERAPTAEHMRMLAVAHRIRENSDILVVVADEEARAGIRGVIELLQGPDRNLRRSKGDPVILWAGSDLSSVSWNQLTRLLEGKDFSICVLSGPELRTETAVAFRNLRWMLERRCGTAQAKLRICAAADAERGALRQMAQENGWECFTLPADAGEGCAVLSPGWLLPLAVAGLDTMALLRGAKKAKAELELRSFENPLWLYTAARCLMARRGRGPELLASYEPGFAGLGAWHRQLFRKPVSFFAPLPGMDPLLHAGMPGAFETLIRFAPPVRRTVIWEDVKDLEGLNHLAGQHLDQLEEQTALDAMAAHADLGIPVISIDCGRADEEQLGELLWFLELGSALCAKLA